MIKLFDVSTATTLAQVLPVLLLALTVELRRLELHRRGRSVARTRALLASFFLGFAIIETVLVLSTDGRLYPFQWSDLAAAIIIFALLCALFVLSMMTTESRRTARTATAAKQSHSARAGATMHEGDLTHEETKEYPT